VRNAVRRELVNEARRSADLLWSLGKPHEFLSTVVVDGVEHAQDALARGRGLILAGIHLGGWEVATALPSLVLQTPVSVIVADDWLAWGIEHRRVAGGLRVLYRDRAALAATRVLRNGEVLLLLGDDGWGDEPRTHRVRFLDADADLPAGIVALSRVCGAPIVTFTVLPLAPRRWKASIDRIVEPPPRDGGAAAEQQTLQVLADRWSAVLRAHPDHWAARHRIRWQERA
jgi:lauroyl/myristoyl acyltransferase